MCVLYTYFIFIFLFSFVGYALGSSCVITCAITGFYLRASVAFFVLRIRATHITVNIFIIVVRMNANARLFLYKPRCILFAVCACVCVHVSRCKHSVFSYTDISYTCFLPTGAVCIARLISYDLCRLIRVFCPIHVLLYLVFWPDRVVIECVPVIVVRAVGGGSVEMAQPARTYVKTELGINLS